MLCDAFAVALRTLRDRAVEPFEGGRRWGAGPAYEWVSATADFGVDPEAPANAGIVDLDLAPLDEHGIVGFDADLRLLRPAEGGNGRLLFVVANRGFLGGVPFSVDVPLAFGVAGPPHPGDGLLLEQGWTIAWCGWQWDVRRAPGLVGLTAPTAKVEPGWVRVEFRLDADQRDHPLSDSSVFFSFTDYPTASLDDPDAVLLVRTAPEASPVRIPRAQWHFSDATTVTLDDGFRAFHWYTLIYRTRHCPIAGTGLLAVRDAVSWLRREHDLTHAFGFGVSQSGRFLRQFLFEGRNLDEQGQVVFDGVFAHIAGARRGEFNHRYAQPSLTHTIGFGNMPPYGTAGLLAKQRATGGAPKLMLTNSSWEYWRGDGALVHVDPATGDDLPEDPASRVYLLSGTDHIGAVPIKDAMPTANPTHTNDVQPLLRALFAALVDWVCEAVAPPDSAIPRAADGTAATRADVLARFAAVPGIHVPAVDALNVTRDVDLGEQAERGVGRWPPVLGAAKPAMVSAVDEDGTERAGVALPLVRVPVTAYTGWNPRRPVRGLPDVLYEFVGSKLPLLSGRPLLDRAEYEDQVRAAATALVDKRLLLAVDTERTVAEALAAYDRSPATVAVDQ